MSGYMREKDTKKKNKSRTTRVVRTKEPLSSELVESFVSVGQINGKLSFESSVIVSTIIESIWQNYTIISYTTLYST